jgi:maltose O-acetyltransferase
LKILSGIRRRLVFAPYYLRDLFTRWRRDIDLEQLRKVASIGIGFNDLPYDRLAGQHCRIFNENTREKVSIGDNVCCNGVLFCNRAGEIVVGDCTVINHSVFVAADVSIRIGRYCFIARDVIIQDNNSHPIDPELRRRQSLYQKSRTTDTYESERAPIVIEDNVWIGTRAIILKGVTIGFGSIVAAGAVVTKAVPALSIVAGNPARVVRTIEPQPTQPSTAEHS